MPRTPHAFEQVKRMASLYIIYDCLSLYINVRDKATETMTRPGRSASPTPHLGLLPSPREQAPDPLWACSRGVVGLPVWRVGPAGIGMWACPFTVMPHPHSRPVSPIIPHVLPSIVRSLRPKAIRQSLGVPPLQIFQYLYRY